ncbi:hypothetical protein GGI25_004353 [Coemansia spiralis]|uniref:GPR180/TMEM145 transmembrane domain-containing protein n=2 Tax=Coemansia TaxID=4863 RepID=A0A9W8G4C0_9FUNG|nr:hypothetical protein EDC05_003050 [Coemansia umbellata]KAJ2621438.1 hypothetical protein GGI26_004120 [Coemansia sp. RSA 1358]KAJ2674413.1 hypothetical protein GGI25_004353 [Coemansia spiralis]
MKHLNIMLAALALLAAPGSWGLNYTGETALLDAAPSDPSKRHATAVTFGELGVFDFRGDGRARVALELGAFSSEKDSRVGKPVAKLVETRVRDASALELDHVYLIFARSRMVNNFVARLHTTRDIPLLCSNVGGWLESEFIAPVSKLRRPIKEEKKPSDKPTVSFISATSASVGLLPKPTKVAGLEKRGNATDAPLLGSDAKANDVFLVEYEWEWLVPHGGEYAVVIANCAATTIQFKYNLIMANRWHSGQWTNLPAGWMPVQQVYPIVCYTLWAVATLMWGIVQVRQWRAKSTQPLATVILGFVPVLRFMSCLADQSRFSLWGNGSYEVTMIIVSTSLVDALADGAHFLVLLALAKGWGVVRSRLAGNEKRTVPALVVFISIAVLYDGVTKGGGLLAVAVLQLTAICYMWASLLHTQRVHGVHVLRLASLNGAAVLREQRGLRGWAKQQPSKPGLALLWSAVRKERLLVLLFRAVLPLQLVDLLMVVVCGFAVPAHYAFIGLLLVQAAHWVAFMTCFLALVSNGLESPCVPLPAIPAIVTRRSIPPPPPSSTSVSPRPLPPLGRLRLLPSSAPFAA